MKKKLALLVGANPRTSDGGPKVKLHEGEWDIAITGIHDSQISVSRDGDIYNDFGFVLNGKNRLILTGPCTAQVVWVKKGTESHISVYAELQNGN